MTIHDMKAKLVVSAIIVALVTPPVALMGQTGQVAGAAAKAATRLAPTGPLTAATRTATLVHTARNAALRGSGALGAGAGTSMGRLSAVMGYLWTAQDGAIGNATVQLRNTVTNAIIDQVQTDAVGGFVFSNIDSGQYVVEYVTDNAKGLMALGHPFTAAPGETVATFVRIANQVPLIVPDLAQNVAAGAVQSASTASFTQVITPIAAVQEAPPPPGPPPVGIAPPVVSIPPSVASSIK